MAAIARRTAAATSSGTSSARASSSESSSAGISNRRSPLSEWVNAGAICGDTSIASTSTGSSVAFGQVTWKSVGSSSNATISTNESSSAVSTIGVCLDVSTSRSTVDRRLRVRLRTRSRRRGSPRHRTRWSPHRRRTRRQYQRPRHVAVTDGVEHEHVERIDASSGEVGSESSSHWMMSSSSFTSTTMSRLRSSATGDRVDRPNPSDERLSANRVAPRTSGARRTDGDGRP